MCAVVPCRASPSLIVVPLTTDIPDRYVPIPEPGILKDLSRAIWGEHIWYHKDQVRGTSRAPSAAVDVCLRLRLPVPCWCVVSAAAQMKHNIEKREVLMSGKSNLVCGILLWRGVGVV